ncbi:MAG: hypothetical protein ACE5I9_06520 [Candidatus Methylomirabilales bacterium]
MARGEDPKDRERERTTFLTFLIGYGGFLAGTILIPLAPTVGGIVFWIGVFGIFWAGLSSAKKR